MSSKLVKVNAAAGVVRTKFVPHPAGRRWKVTGKEDGEEGKGSTVHAERK
jgi:hypothetical protein